MLPEIKEKSKDIYLSKKYHDVVLCSGHEEISASKLSLAIRSPFLEQLIDTALNEGNQTLYMNDFRPEILQRVVELIETGETVVPTEDVIDFNQCTNWLGIKDVKDMNSDEPLLLMVSKDEIWCQICNKKFTRQFSANRHHKTQHAPPGGQKKTKATPTKPLKKEKLDSPEAKVKAEALVKLEIKKKDANENDETDPLAILKDQIKAEAIEPGNVSKPEARVPPTVNRKRKTESSKKEPKGKAIKK